MRFFLLSFVLVAEALYAVVLPDKVASAIARSPLKTSDVSIWVAPVDDAVPVVDLHSGMPRTPASIEKIITTGVSLFLLGEHYRWPLEFYTNGRIKNGVLDGDLYIKGYGNPYLVEEKLIDIVAEFRNLGIDSIVGDVVLDNSYFTNALEDPDEFDGHGLAPYNAIPNALSVNFRTVSVVIENNQKRIKVRTDPALSYAQIDNQLKFNKSKKCKGRGFSPHISVDRPQDKIILAGSISRQCRTREVVRVLADAGDVFFGYLQKAWHLTGGEKMTNRWYYGVVEDGMTALFRGQSRPLYEQISAMNKLSNNIMTRQLFLTLGAELTEPPATLDKSRAVVINQLTLMGIDTDKLFIDNGSGLSRRSKVSAAQMGAFLIAMQDKRVKTYFEESLSVAGVDGTLKRRLRGTPLAGNAIGKTGTLKDAKSIVGYLTAKSGRKYAYAILLEGPQARTGRPLMDEVMQWIYTL